MLPLDLSPLCNSHGWTSDGERRLGMLNAWGNSLPAEERPEELLVGGFRYRLPCAGAAGDHVEAWGQRILLPRPGRVLGLGLLAAGEMGERTLAVELLRHGEVVETMTARAPSFMLTAAEWDAPAVDRVAFSHFHYPGDYDLDLLRPALFHLALSPRRGEVADMVGLGWNPLFHLFAATVRLGEGCP